MATLSSICEDSDYLEGQDNLFNKIQWKEEEGTPVKRSFWDSRIGRTRTVVVDPLRVSSQAFFVQTLQDYYSPDDEHEDDYWDCEVKLDDLGLLKLENVVVKEEDPSGPHGHHPHAVFESVEFKDLKVIFQYRDTNGDKQEIGVDISDSIASDVEYYKGTFGQSDFDSDDDLYHAGIMQKLYCYFGFNNREHIVPIEISLSVVFKYPENKFEPLGIIDACKIFPQITFDHFIYVFPKEYLPVSEATGEPVLFADKIINDIDLPSGADFSSVRIRGYRGRVKLIANNNNMHHVDLEQDINDPDIYYDKNHFAEFNRSDVPDYLQKVFKQGYIDKNVAGFYADSNREVTFDLDTTPVQMNDSRKFFSGNIPMWVAIFDYTKYGLEVEKEIEAVYGYNDSTHFNMNTQSFKTSSGLYDWPANNLDNNSITVDKSRRHGQYDNIHLHGYLGHYKDNDEMVIHAPICGQCCFHMHWRWGAINYNTADMHPFLEAQRNFLGWASMEDSCGNYLYTASKQVPGNPLIPPTQSLKVAITSPSLTTAYDDDNVLGNTFAPIWAETTKAVWYSADIVAPSSFGSHVILEQGCGYSHRYWTTLSNTFEIATTIADFLVDFVDKVPLPQLRLFRRILKAIEALQSATSVHEIYKPTRIGEWNLVDFFEFIYRGGSFHYPFSTDPNEPFRQVPDGEYVGNLNGTTAAEDVCL